MSATTITACCLSLAAATMAAAEARPTLDQLVLTEMNEERSAVGVPPLTWDPQLASDAAAYAGVVAATGRFEHSPRDSRPDQSENLWMGTRGAFTAQQAVRSWAAEKARFRPGIYPDVSTTGSAFDVSHYTQMIWRGTTRVGCAMSQSRTTDYLVCRFSPRGNRDGQRLP